MLDSDLLSPSRIYAGISVNSKKRLLEMISAAFVEKDKELDAREIFESLCKRENLGSTSLGNGVAMPHGRIEGTKVVEAVFIQLLKPVPFDAEDGQPVDLIFALVVPKECSEDHLKLLAKIADRFTDTKLVEQLRHAEDASVIWQALSSPNP